jgi:hypothetical protein
MVFVRFPPLQETHEVLVRNVRLNVDAIAVDAEKHVGGEERHTLVAVHKRMIYQK